MKYIALLNYIFHKMSINYIFYFIILLFIIIFSIVNVIFVNEIFNNNDYNQVLNNLKRKLLFYVKKYKNCNSTLTPLYCGHKYEGYKVQKKGLYPNSVIVNLSNYYRINNIGNTKCKGKEVIIGVVCSPDSFLQRVALRMGYLSHNIVLLFFTGLSNNKRLNELVMKENNYYHDIIIYDFVSNYFNSSLMLVLELYWIFKYCKNYKYFIYQTPDVFFNYCLFFKTYVKKGYTYPLIAQILRRNRVIRSNRSRFYVPFSVYNNTHYPPQPNGPLIAFSLNTVRHIINNINKVKMTFWMDDVYLAFILHHIKIRTYHFKNVISMYPVQIKKLPNISVIIKKVMYIHSLPPGSIFFLMQIASEYYKPD